jgi:hypothetical protein
VSFINYEENLPTPGAPEVTNSTFDTYPAVFVDVQWKSGNSDGTPSTIILNVTYANTTSCSGAMATNICVLKPAVLEYHTNIINNTVSLTAPLTNLTILALANNTNVVEIFSTNSTLGGIAMAAEDIFGAG